MGALDYERQELAELIKMRDETATYKHTIFKDLPQTKNSLTGKINKPEKVKVVTRHPIDDVVNVEEYRALLEGLNPSELFNKQAKEGLSKGESYALRKRQELYMKLKNDGLHGETGVKVNGVETGLSQEVKNGLRDVDGSYKDVLAMEEFISSLPNDANKRSKDFDRKAFDWLVNAQKKGDVTDMLEAIDNQRLLMPNSSKFKLNIGESGYSTHSKDLQIFDEYGDIRSKFQSAVEASDVRDTTSGQGQQVLATALSAATKSGYGMSRGATSALRGMLMPKYIAGSVAGENFVGKNLAGRGFLGTLPGAVSKGAGYLGELPGKGLFKMLGNKGEEVIGRLKYRSKPQLQKISRSSVRDSLLQGYSREGDQRAKSNQRKEMESKRNQGVMQKQNSWQGVR